MRATFEVEQAGCQSCAARVREALGAYGEVEAIDVDEDADLATVRALDLSEEDADRALADASDGSGHAYRVKPGSWRAL